MGRSHKRPKKHLCFSALLEVLQNSFEKIKDLREEKKSSFKIPDVYKAAFAMFFFQDKSLLEFQKQMEKKYRRSNLATVYNVTEIPGDSQFREIIDMHSSDSINPVFKNYFSRLQRGKHLEKFKILNDSYLITIDGSEYFSSNKLNCEKCLKKEHKKGDITYQHQILQVTLVHPDIKQVIPLAP